MTTGCCHNDLIGRVAVEGAGETATLDEDSAARLEYLQFPVCERRVEPLVQRTIERQLALLDLLRDFPDRDGRQPRLSAAACATNGGSRAPGEPPVFGHPPEPRMRIKQDHPTLRRC